MRGGDGREGRQGEGGAPKFESISKPVQHNVGKPRREGTNTYAYIHFNITQLYYSLTHLLPPFLPPPPPLPLPPADCKRAVVVLLLQMCGVLGHSQ